jgi:pimeloyl-ACP methyl ester carboxylesterase
MATTEQGAERMQDYVAAGGLRTYYEALGAGEPLVLLHGGLCTIETWGGQASALAERYRVYLPERRGHGRTPDVEGPFTYGDMADDTIAFMDALAIGRAHLVGWSDGALVGLIVALRRPDLVSKLVLIGQPVTLDGARPEYAAMLEQMTPDSFPPMLQEAYAAVSPDGADHFAVVFEKCRALWASETGIAVADLAAVAVPTLILLGDDDLPTIEHAGALQRALSDSQLGVVPGASHGLPMEKPELTNWLILDFLAAEQVPKMMAA